MSKDNLIGGELQPSVVSKIIGGNCYKKFILTLYATCIILVCINYIIFYRGDIMKAREKVPFNFLMDKGMKEILRQKANDLGINMSGLVNVAINDYLKQDTVIVMADAMKAMLDQESNITAKTITDKCFPSDKQ